MRLALRAVLVASLVLVGSRVGLTGAILGLAVGLSAVLLEHVLLVAGGRVFLLGAGGFCGGVILGSLFGHLVSLLSPGFAYQAEVTLGLTLTLGYLGAAAGASYAGRQFPGMARNENRLVRPGSPKILDTSAVIDGRIADVWETSFLDGTLVIPRFILRELQMIADSSDSMRRARGRRGLDILKRMQEEEVGRIEIADYDPGGDMDVDTKLVHLARQMGGSIITNDLNLNKVAQVEGVTVLNVNDLANALRPVVLPGEEMVVRLIKPGKEVDQGVGYREDGTMVVVEGAGDAVGQTVRAEVTSVLQTSAGRMIFCKLLHAREGVGRFAGRSQGAARS